MKTPQRILIVENDPLTSTEIKQMVIQMGYAVTAVVSSGEAAVQSAYDDPPAAVLMDIHLAGEMDGIEAAGRIRRNYEVPIIYLTALAGEDQITRAKLTAPFGYLLKPFRYRELQVTLDVALYKHAMERELKATNQRLEQEIAERLRAETRLRQSERELKLTLDATTDGIWTWTFTPNELFFSPKYYTMLGYEPDEFPASVENWQALIHQEDRERALQIAAEWLQTKSGVYSNEFRLRAKTGEYRWIHARGKVIEWDEQGRAMRMIGTHEDITARKLSEAALQESERRLRQAQELAHIGHWDWDRPTNILEWSDEVFRIFGQDPEHFQPSEEAFKAAVHPGDLERVLGEQQQSFKAKQNVDIEYRIVRPDGEIRHIQMLTQNVLDPQGELVQVMGTVQDITDRKRMEAELQHQLRKREEQHQLLIQRSKLESLGKLAAGIAHEINQPLASMSMGLENLLFKFEVNGVTTQYLAGKLQHILEDISRIKQVIEHVRTFSRDQTPVLLEKIDVNQVCRQAVSMLHTQYLRHNVQLTLTLDETIGYVLGNQYKLEQVILNLLTNAKDAVDEKARAQALSAYQKQITLTTSCDDAHILIAIHDNGLGIAEAVIHSIFDPFFTTKSPEQGTGLGLSISYGIVKEMQGDIEVESRLGEQTIMRVILPRVK